MKQLSDGPDGEPRDLSHLREDAGISRENEWATPLRELAQKHDLPLDLKSLEVSSNNLQRRQHSEVTA